MSIFGLPTLTFFLRHTKKYMNSVIKKVIILATVKFVSDLRQILWWVLEILWKAIYNLIDTLQKLNKCRTELFQCRLRTLPVKAWHHGLLLPMEPCRWVWIRWGNTTTALERIPKTNKLLLYQYWKSLYRTIVRVKNDLDQWTDLTCPVNTTFIERHITVAFDLYEIIFLDQHRSFILYIKERIPSFVQQPWRHTWSTSQFLHTIYWVLSTSSVHHLWYRTAAVFRNWILSHIESQTYTSNIWSGYWNDWMTRMIIDDFRTTRFQL